MPVSNNFMACDLRRLESCDSLAMAALEKRCFSLPWSVGQCQTALNQPAFAAYGLWQKTELCAYISLYHSPDEMEILNIAVLPELRRQGHGRRMLALVLQVGRKIGMQKATLEVRESNQAAIALYEQLGFARCGRRKRYYPDNKEDAIIYIFKFI